MQIVSIDSKNVDSMTREGQDLPVFYGGFQPICGGDGAGIRKVFGSGSRL